MQIVVGDAARIGVDDGGGGPLIFAGNGRDLARERTVDLRCQTLDELFDLTFVVGVVERPEKRHGQSFDLLFGDQKTNGRFGGRVIELLQNRALIVRPLSHSDDAIRDQQAAAPARS